MGNPDTGRRAAHSPDMKTEEALGDPHFITNKETSPKAINNLDGISPGPPKVTAQQADLHFT